MQFYGSATVEAQGAPSVAARATGSVDGKLPRLKASARLKANE